MTYAVITASQLVLPLLYLLLGLGSGLLFERIILPRLARLTTRTSWRADEIICAALRGVATLWFLLAGVYLALHKSSIFLRPATLATADRILLVLLILSLTVALARLVTGLLTAYLGRFENLIPSISIFTNVAKLIVYIIGLLIVLERLDIAITPILTALGVGGLAVALALQQPLANLFSGLQLIAARSVRPGDYVRLDTGEEGYVVDITWHDTTIRELANNTIIVPNAKLTDAIIKNFHLPEQKLAVLVEVGVSYDSNLEHVERVTVEVAQQVMREVTGGVPDFEPFIRYHTFDDSSINFTVILRGNQFVDQFLIKHEFIKRLQQRYKVEGIEIPFPIRTVHLRGQATQHA